MTKKYEETTTRKHWKKCGKYERIGDKSEDVFKERSENKTQFQGIL